MSTVRRRVLRTSAPHTAGAIRRQRQIARRRDLLAHQRVGFDRWMARLCRAFNALEKHRRAISRLERQLADFEQG
jgi:hypothetical protein